jgi:hypothetical protein
MKFILSFVLVLLLSGCRGSGDSDAALAMAEDAYEEGRRANAALSDGAGNSSTMGQELQEALDRAEVAESQALAAQSAADAAMSAARATESRIDELEAKVNAICLRAPGACY